MEVAPIRWLTGLAIYVSDLGEKRVGLIKCIRGNGRNKGYTIWICFGPQGPLKLVQDVRPTYQCVGNTNFTSGLRIRP